MPIEKRVLPLPLRGTGTENILSLTKKLRTLKYPSKLNIMDKLLKLQYKGWWIQVSPLASKRKWICAIYKEVRNYWVTEETKSDFTTPKEAYEWAFAKIHKDIDL